MKDEKELEIGAIKYRLKDEFISSFSSFILHPCSFILALLSREDLAQHLGRVF
jgi:hypothetical protein